MMSLGFWDVLGQPAANLHLPEPINEFLFRECLASLDFDFYKPLWLNVVKLLHLVLFGYIILPHP